MNDLFGAAKGPGGAKPAPAKRGKPIPAPQADDYSAKDIEVLEGLEPVRRRPGMYIGGADETALHHLAAEILDNAMDEAVAGHASFIEVSLEALTSRAAKLIKVELIEPEHAIGKSTTEALQSGAVYGFAG